MTQLVDFADVDETMLDEVGGKGRSLGLLFRAGFAVPDGFCITTAAYRSHTAGRLDALLAELVADPPPAELPALAAAARAAVLETPLAEELAAAVLDRYRDLGPDAAVAVRSSATAEDLPDASFAGQQDSYLNVVGADALLDAVRRCWASLWTDRAVSYRVSNGIDQQTVALSVVVQRMVDADVAGVLFTADPVTGTRTHTVIDASPGLGEAVVSGAVNPDHVLADSATGAVLDRRIGDKRMAIRGVAGGGTERTELNGSSKELCVSDRQVADLVDLGRRVQEFTGTPQDIEWAIAADGELWLTQARPITTLYPVPATSQPGLRIFVCMTLAQGLTRPITPMGLAAYRRIGSALVGLLGDPPADPAAGPDGLVAVGQRQFVDITPLVSNPRARRLAIRVTGVMEARTSAVLTALSGDDRFPAEGGGSPVPTVARLMWISKLPFRLLIGLADPRWAYSGIAALERRLRRRLAIADDATPGQRLDFVERRLGTDSFLLMPKTFGYAVGGFLAMALARRLLRGHADPAELQTVLRGLPHNVTTEMDLELWALTTRIRSDDASAAVFHAETTAEIASRFRTGRLPTTAQQGLADFLSRYGHRAVAEIDLGVPRWSEEPEHLIGAIANYLQLPDGKLAPDQTFARGVAEGEAAVVELTERAARLGPVRGRAVGWALSRARRLTGLREYPKFLLVLSLAAMRAQLRAVGAAAAATGAIAAGDDIFWLDLNEARRALNGERLVELVVERREAYARELRRRHVPRILLSDGTEPEASLGSTGGPDGLRGSPASAGVVTGVARVVLDPATARLEPGDILVAPSTDPGWTPLFLTAGGLVMEMGGSNSHGAVVAREYGIPAVVGVPAATSTIQDGQIITVDGGAGLVRVEAEPVPVP